MAQVCCQNCSLKYSFSNGELLDGILNDEGGGSMNLRIQYTCYAIL